MLADHARIVERLDHAGAGDGDFARARLDRDEVHRVEMLIVIFELEMRVVILHLPAQDFLALGLLGRQTHALQRMDHRIGEGIMGGVADRKSHRESLYARNR